jgi:small subunit ribosomal protein S4
VKTGDSITVRDRIRSNSFLQAAVDHAKGRGLPPWLSLDAENVRGTVVTLPLREHVTLPIQEQMIIELYSK